MKTGPGQLRSKAVKGAPFLAMSATATLEEVEELQANTGLRSCNTVVLRSDPVQGHFNYVKVQRPPNLHGSFGSENSAGEPQPGLIHLLNRLILDDYVEKVRNGENGRIC